MNPQTAASITTAIAIELGPNWSHVTGGPRFPPGETLCRADGLEILVVLDWKRNRLKFSQNLDPAAGVPESGQRVRAAWPAPSITATAKKTAAKLARDIAHRLLPKCEQSHADLLGSVARENKEHQEAHIFRRVGMSDFEVLDSYRMRNMIAETFHGRRKASAALRDPDGRPALCSFPHFFRTPAGGIKFSCWQRHPATGHYREVTAMDDRTESQTTIGSWQAVRA